MWLGSLDRSEAGAGPIIITDSPDSPVYLERREAHDWKGPSINGWLLIEQPLRASDAASFFAEFGSSWALLLKCSLDVQGQPHHVRGFIKNGRKEGWTISLDIDTA